jgi:membrane-associated phospholipid phosphatase
MSITEISQSLDFEILKTIGWLLNDAIIYGLVLIVLLFVGERRKKKRTQIILSMVIAVLVGLLVKQWMAIERPCIGEDWCPNSYSFPSTHAVAAFTLMAGFIRNRNYPYYVLFALFVAFTRLNLGVHFFQDIAAALPIALVSYYVTRNVMKDEKGN